MPKLVMRYNIPQEQSTAFAQMLLKKGGRGGLCRTAKLLGVHRDTLMRGLRRRTFGTTVGKKIIDGLSKEYPDISTKYLVFTVQ
jgi:hypothetical protein